MQQHEECAIRRLARKIRRSPGRVQATGQHLPGRREQNDFGKTTSRSRHTHISRTTAGALLPIVETLTSVPNARTPRFLPNCDPWFQERDSSRRRMRQPRVAHRARTPRPSQSVPQASKTSSKLPDYKSSSRRLPFLRLGRGFSRERSRRSTARK